MSQVTIKTEKLVHGGKSLARFKQAGSKQRTLFVDGALPNETVRVALPTGRGSTAKLIEVVKPSPLRIAPRCRHAGQSGDCDFQHLNYEDQLRFKAEIVRDQMIRIGGIDKFGMDEIRPNPTPWHYQIEARLSPSNEGQLGYWSRQTRQVLALDDCHLLHPSLRALLREIDLNLPDLRKVNLRVGVDDAVLVALEINNVEPPEIEIDFPVSVAIIFPDGVAATLIGDPFLVQQVKDHEWHVSAGSFFHPSLAGAEQLVDTVLNLAQLNGNEFVVDGYCGVGLLTYFLSQQASEVVGIEKNADAIEDAATNLDETENVALYNDWFDLALPNIEQQADLIVLDVDETGLSTESGQALLNHYPQRVIISNPNIATAARDAAEMANAGYKLRRLIPLDMRPQTYHIHTITLWERNKKGR